MNNNHDPETGEIPPDRPNVQLPETVTQIPGKALHEIASPPFQELPRTPFDKLGEAISTVTEKIAEHGVAKKGHNKFHDYNFARMEDILKELAPLIAKNGITIMQSEVERGFLDKGTVVYVTYDFTIIHKSGQVWPFPQRSTGQSRTRDSKGGYDDKSINKCHTQARKYFLLSLFQIPTTDKDDADRGDNDRAPKQTKAPERKPAVKALPHEIPRPEGIKAIEWARQFVEQIKMCADNEAIAAWQKANLEALQALKKQAPQIHERVSSVVDDMQKAFNQPPESENPASG